MIFRRVAPQSEETRKRLSPSLFLSLGVHVIVAIAFMRMLILNAEFSPARQRQVTPQQRLGFVRLAQPGSAKAATAGRVKAKFAERDEWLTHAIEEVDRAVSAQEWLLPDPNQLPTTVDSHVDRSAGDVAADVRGCVQLAADAGVEVIVVDQSRPDIELAVCKVLAPARFGLCSRSRPEIQPLDRLGGDSVNQMYGEAASAIRIPTLMLALLPSGYRGTAT